MTYVAFVRGINVGGRNNVAMSVLRDAFTHAGATDVRTHGLTGNVLFEGRRADIDALGARLARALRERGGPDTAIMVRTLDALAAAATWPKAARPQPDEKQYVTFLAAEPKPRLRPPLRSPAGDVTVVGVSGREAFSLGRRVGSKPGFPNEFIERTTGLAATTRALTVVQKMAALGKQGRQPEG